MKGTPITDQLYDYIAEMFASEDDLLKHMPAEAECQGIPMMHIDATQGKFLQVLMRACNAKRVVEVGSLFGYSAIWMARALPADGKLVALEINPLHVRVIRENAQRAGMADKIEVIEGDARETLPALRSRSEPAHGNASALNLVADSDEQWNVCGCGEVIRVKLSFAAYEAIDKRILSAYTPICGKASCLSRAPSQPRGYMSVHQHSSGKPRSDI
jgi:SAM-dependent methyltransferase